MNRVRARVVQVMQGLKKVTQHRFDIILQAKSLPSIAICNKHTVCKAHIGVFAKALDIMRTYKCANKLPVFESV